MHAVNGVKTVLAPKTRLQRALFLFGALFFLVSTIGLTILITNNKAIAPNAICYAPYPDLMAGKSQYVTGGGNPTDCTLTLEKADTPEKRQQGLSGRKDIVANTGVLFVFDSPGRQCMWMKDMNFNIDIIWLSSEKEIIHIEENVSPKTFPQSFCGAEPALYVLEVKAGVANATGFHIGDHLNL